jgi:hypothetical protein
MTRQPLPLVCAAVTLAVVVWLAMAGPAPAQDLTEPGAAAGVAVQAPEAGAGRPAPQADDSPRVRGLEHLGLRLGMPADAVAERFGVQVEPVPGAQDPNLVQHYRAELVTERDVKLTLRFDRAQALYLVESTQVLKPGVSAPALKQRVESKYGPADVAGRMGLGTYRVGYVDPSAELNVYADIALAGRDAPTTIRVELVDHARRAANQAAFQAEARAQGAEPAAQPQGDTRVEL